MAISGQDKGVEDLKVSDNKYQQQKTKSIENTEERGIARVRFGETHTPERNEESVNSELECYDL